jgi:hypothetical protein
MLACIPKPYCPWRIPNTGYEETQAVAKTKTSAKTKTAARTTAKSASHKTKASTAKSTTVKGQPAGEKLATIDRRRGSRRDEEKDKAVAAAKPAVAAAPLERRQKVNRRRQIDPTTCERDYTDDEVEFMNALDDYKRKNGRMFPTCSEVLEVVRSLGYVRLSPNELAAHTPAATQQPMAMVASVEEEVESENDWQ